jgi:hypothetical protein
MNDDILARLLSFESLTDSDLAKLMVEAADEIERLRKELRICQAERDHHLKWSKNYETEIYKLRDQIRKKNSN